jgi:hypothetical protein
MNRMCPHPKRGAGRAQERRSIKQEISRQNMKIPHHFFPFFLNPGKIYRYSNKRKNMKYLLFIALLMSAMVTAGCIGENKNTIVTPASTAAVNASDPIVGIWQWTTPDGTKLYTFSFFSDGRYSFTDSSDPNTLPGTWSKVREHEYLIVYTSGKNQALVYTPATDTFTMPEFTGVLAYRLGKEPVRIYTSTITPNTPVVTAIQTENTDAIQTQLNGEWKQIRDSYDTFNVNMNKRDLTNNDEINSLRQEYVPHTISEYQKIKDDLLKININDSDLKNERNVLVSICDYKIKFLQGLSSVFHARQAETFNVQTSLNEYQNAKNYFQDVRDSINVIPYSNKYWEYINNDDQQAKEIILFADQGISRMSKLV